LHDNYLFFLRCSFCLEVMQSGFVPRALSRSGSTGRGGAGGRGGQGKGQGKGKGGRGLGQGKGQDKGQGKGLGQGKGGQDDEAEKKRRRMEKLAAFKARQAQKASGDAGEAVVSKEEHASPQVEVPTGSEDFKDNKDGKNNKDSKNIEDSKLSAEGTAKADEEAMMDDGPSLREQMLSLDIDVRTVDRYEQLGTVGRGEFGVVFKARERETGQVVAMKRMIHDFESEGVFFPLVFVPLFFFS
jgi:hypothetical protein